MDKTNRACQLGREEAKGLSLQGPYRFATYKKSGKTGVSRYYSVAAKHITMWKETEVQTEQAKTISISSPKAIANGGKV